MTRRAILGGTLLAVSGGTAACATGNDRPEREPASSAAGSGSPGGVLLAYFSRPGENYWYGGRRDLDTGNTEVLAGVVGRLLRCDVHRIEAADPYPDDYEKTVRRNVTEQDDDARPRIANAIPSIDGHGTVLLASPIWNVRPPMIMRTFAEALDFTGRTVHPVTTHAMSGLGTSERDYATACRGATIAEGLAVQGETVGDAEPAVEAWLRRTGLLPG